MFTALDLANLGPHTATRLVLPDPMGHAWITGGSEVGKSTLIDAVTVVLWGVSPDGRPFDVAQISDGQDKAGVALTTARGTVLGRTVTRRRSWTRTMGTETFASDDAMRTKLGNIGARAELGRAIVAPLQWRALLTRDLGRPLRDLILSVVGEGDLRTVVGEMMGGRLRPSDPVDPKAAATLLTAANSSRDAARGWLDAVTMRKRAETVDVPDTTDARAILTARDAWTAYGSAGDVRATRDAQAAELRRRIDTPAPTGPAEEDVAKAARVMAALDAWTKHDTAATAYEAARTRHADAVRRRDEVRAARATLGERPTVDTVGLAAKRAQIARVDTKPFASAVAEKAGALTVAETKLRELSGKSDDCPTCGQTWAARAEARAKAVEIRDAAKAEHDRATKALATTAASLDALRAEIAALEAAETAAKTWDQRSRDIGQEPAVPVAPVEPTAPELRRPTTEHTGWARRIQAEATETATLTKRHVADVEKATADLAALGGVEATAAEEPTVARPSADQVSTASSLIEQAALATAANARAVREAAEIAAEVTDAQATVDAADIEAKRASLLVLACRQAPTRIAEEQAAALGDMGPVTLRFPPKESKDTPEIEVLIDGRPWYLASRGRLIYACARFRCALRRAAGLVGLPVVIDDAGSWSGEWDGVVGPAWFLVTTTGAIGVSSALEAA